MQKGSMRQRRLCRFRMRRRFEWEKAARFRPGDLGKNWDNFGLGLMGGGRGGEQKWQSRGARAPIWDQLLKWASCFYIRFDSPLNSLLCLHKCLILLEADDN